MKRVWSEFIADEEWKEIQQVTSAQHGDLVSTIEDRVVTMSPYSVLIQL